MKDVLRSKHLASEIIILVRKRRRISLDPVPLKREISLDKNVQILNVILNQRLWQRR